MQPETTYAPLGEDRVAYQVLGEGPTWCSPWAPSGTSTCSGRTRGRAVPAPAGLVLPADHLRPPRHRRLRPLPRGHAAALGGLRRRGGRGHGRRRVAAGRAHGHDRRGRPDGAVLRRHPARADQRPGPGNASARYVAADDYPIGIPPERAEAIISRVEDTWGTAEPIATAIPSRAGDERFRRWVARLQRSIASPDGPRLPAGPVRGRRPPAAPAGPGADPGAAPPRLRRCSRSSTAATWPSTSPTPGWSSCPAPTAP